MNEYGDFLDEMNYLTDPAVNREKELKSLEYNLATPDMPSTILVGEAVVGKTSLVKGLAYRIKNGLVPNYLKDKKILAINSSRFVEGTMYRGDFERNVRSFINEIIEYDDVIIFIDEIHSVMEQNNHLGCSFCDMLKPYLDNGLIKMIGATTTEEYEELILKDKAFNRRFERLNIKEPNKEQVFSILNNSIEPLEKTTDVKFGYYAEERDRILRLIVDATAKDKQNFNDSIAYPASSLQILKRSFAVSLVDDKSIVDLTSIIKAFDESSRYHLPPAIRLELSNYNLSKKSSSKVVEFQKRK